MAGADCGRRAVDGATCRNLAGILRRCQATVPTRRSPRALPRTSGGALKAFGKLNVPLYRPSRGRLFGQIAGTPVLLLTTVGRRSGQPRTVPVVYLPDGKRLVVIGSNAGHRAAPAWSLNLEANPVAEVEVGGERR